MRDDDYGARVERAMRLAEARTTAMELLPKTALQFDKWDKADLKGQKRRHGDKSKLKWAQEFEEIAVGAVKVLKKAYVAYGETTVDAWELARKDVGRIIGRSPTTLEEWQNGRPRRRRKKAKR